MVVKRIIDSIKSWAGIIISIAILIITLYSAFYSQPNANKITHEKLQEMAGNLQQIANSTYSQKPFLIGDASCYFFTSSDVKKFNFSKNDSNNYYADIFRLRVKSASANNPRMKVLIPKAIQFEYVKTFPEEIEPRIKKSYELENMNILVSWQEKVPIEETRQLVVLYDTKYIEQLKSEQRTYVYGSDDSEDKRLYLDCAKGWVYFEGFK